MQAPDIAVEKPSMVFYVGTYTGAKSKGIYRIEMDREGKLSEPVLAGESVNPSFLATHPSGKYLLAINEIGEFQGSRSGSVSSFAIDPQTHNLKLLNQQPSAGVGPCYVGIDRTGKVALTANYGDGGFGVFPIGADGSLQSASATFKGDADGVRAHGHCFNVDPTNAYAFAIDLGLNKVFVHRLDVSSGKIAPAEPAFVVGSALKAGPRVFAFHPDGKVMYVLNELNSTIAVYNWDATEGQLTDVETVSMLPADYTGKKWGAEVAVHPSGKFVYVSNRAHDSIAVFTVAPGSGRLALRSHQSVGGKTPRHFSLDPSGGFLVVANQDSDNVVSYRIDQSTGDLTSTGSQVTVGSPTCVRFISK